MKRLLAACLAAIALLVTTGCATTTAPGVQPPAPVSKEDPWERWNRKVFGFNEAIDKAVIRPVATVYEKVVPQLVRTGVTNFYGNFADAWSAVNNLLQGKLADTAQDVMRVGANTLFGIGGIFDVATELGLDSQREDLGQTLGYWGFKPGPYLVLPILGPSTVRETVALPLDRYISPALTFVNDSTTYTLAVTLGLLNDRANLLPTSRMLDDMALDKYVFVRDAYLQRRRSLVYDGNEPQSEEESFEADPVPPPAAASAPVPAASASAPTPEASASGPAAAASQSGN